MAAPGAVLPAGGLLFALAGLTGAVMVGALRSLDAHLLVVLRRLDTPPAGHLLARAALLGGQFWLVGSLLAGAVSLAAWHHRTWRPLLVPLAAVIIAAARDARAEGRHRPDRTSLRPGPPVHRRHVISARACRERHHLPAAARGAGSQPAQQRRWASVLGSGTAHLAARDRSSRRRQRHGRAHLPLAQRRRRRTAPRLAVTLLAIRVVPGSPQDAR